MASAAWRAANPEKRRKYERERSRRRRMANPWAKREYKHRLLAADSEWSMFAAQGGLCWLCGKALPDDPAQAHIDHDHRCCGPGRSCWSCRRGLAHPQCNLIIGMAGDDPEWLHRMADSLEAWQRDHQEFPGQMALFDLPDAEPGDDDEFPF